MKEIDRKQIGRVGLSMAINYFTCQGYTVSLPMNDTQWYDLVIEKNGKFETVQCKATQTKNDKIDFRSTGGTNGSVYDNLLNHPELDWLFCVNKDFKMWLIPVNVLTTDTERALTLTLREKPAKNNQGFQMYKYQVHFLNKT